ncbi:MAG: tRNA pseudouridine synthase [Pseudomonadota bacterium]
MPPNSWTELPILHRDDHLVAVDKPSGLLVHRTDAQSSACETNEVRKTYQAIVRGWPPDQGIVDRPLRREDEDPWRTPSRQTTQDALTHYRTVQRFVLPIPDIRPNGQQFDQTRFALIELHPIIGDATHGKGPLNRAVAAHWGLSRMWLQAQRLELPVHWERLRLEIRLPLWPLAIDARSKPYRAPG